MNQMSNHSHYKARRNVHGGKPTWHGYYLDGGLWRLVRSALDAPPIEYATEGEAIEAAKATLRFDGDVPVQPRQINQARRRDDVGNDLWRTFNRAQENLIRGDITYNHTNDQGVRSRRTTRPVNGIDGNVALNRAMWALASRMQELKAA
jgi:hypothetical protein